jgi:hypothetical protein
VRTPPASAVWFQLQPSSIGTSRAPARACGRFGGVRRVGDDAAAVNTSDQISVRPIHSMLPKSLLGIETHTHQQHVSQIAGRMDVLRLKVCIDARKRRNKSAVRLHHDFERETPYDLCFEPNYFRASAKAARLIASFWTDIVLNPWAAGLPDFARSSIQKSAAAMLIARQQLNAPRSRSLRVSLHAARARPATSGEGSHS